MRLLRLFNEPVGQKRLEKEGVKKALLEKLPILGISSICNLLASVKMAKYYELNEDDVIFTIFTDSAGMYQSRLKELEQEDGKYSRPMRVADFARYLQGVGIDWIKELFVPRPESPAQPEVFHVGGTTGQTVEELDALWEPEFWDEMFAQVPGWDKLIKSSTTGRCPQETVAGQYYRQRWHDQKCDMWIGQQDKPSAALAARDAAMVFSRQPKRSAGSGDSVFQRNRSTNSARSRIRSSG